MQVPRVPPGRAGSWEDVLHTAGADDKLLIFSDGEAVRSLADRIGHRAIGVVYHPERERYGNYVPTDLPGRYDALLFFETTKALHPLHVPADFHEVPETYPSGV